MILVVMGVCACGKTTVGQKLAHELNWQFYDGDDFHSQANRARMAQGIPLTDVDRQPWLSSLADFAQKQSEHGRSIVMACSALKYAYRQTIRGCDSDDHSVKTGRKGQTEIRFLYLKLNEDMVRQRLMARKGHFFNTHLVQSQFETLEEPKEDIEKDVLTIDGNLHVVDMVPIVKSWLNI